MNVLGGSPLPAVAPGGFDQVSPTSGSDGSGASRAWDGAGLPAACRVSLVAFALVLLVSAGLKLYALLFPTAAPASTAAAAFQLLVVVAEWALAAWVLVGCRQHLARRLAIATLVVFASITGWRAAQREPDCGCFGGLRVPPAVTFTFDLVALGIIFYTGRPRAWAGHRGPRRPSPGRWRIGAGVALSALVPLGAAGANHVMTMTARSGRTIVHNHNEWIGKPFPLLEFVDPLSQADLVSGLRTVIVVDHDCHKCHDYVASLLPAWGGAAADARVRLIDVGEPGTGGGFGLPAIRLGPEVLYAAGVPMEVVLLDGVVQSARRPLP